MPQTIIKNVTVIPMRQPGVLPNRDVLIKDGLIAEVVPAGTKTYAADSHVLPADGRFLMPGLHDMHTHASDRVNRSQLYLLHGVTTIRDTACAPELFPWRAKNPPGVAMVPEVYAPGPILEGEKQQWKGRSFSRVVIGKKQVESAIIEAQNRGADFLKIYHTLAKEDYLHAARFAHGRGLKVAGHTHRESTINEVAGALDSIEHAEDLVRYHVKNQRIQDFVGAAAPVLVEKNVALCPTLILTKQGARLTEEGQATLERELVGELRYIDARTRNYWNAPSRQRNTTDLRRAAELTGSLYRAGVKLLLGTDSQNPFVLPGHSTIQELCLLVELADLTPYQALRVGTLGAAEFLGVNAGSVEPGQKANLVLVEQNPFRNLTTLEKPTDVFVRGRHFTRETLETSLEELS